MNRNPLVAELASGPFSSIYGEFAMHAFTDGKDESVVVVLGDIRGKENVLCRIQSECISSHVFFGTICDCREQMAASLQMIKEEGEGIAIYLNQEGRGNGAAAHIGTLKYRRQGYSQSQAYEKLGFMADRRHYRIAAKVLESFGIKSVRLISSNINKKDALINEGINVTSLVYYSGTIIYLGSRLDNVITAINDGDAKPAIPEGRHIFVLGDLNVDYLIGDIRGGEIVQKPEPKVGGTGFNAALAFFDQGLMPILFGKVGDDQHGRLIQEALKEQGFFTLMGLHLKKPTGSSNIIFVEGQRWLMQDKDNASDYDLKNLEQALAYARIGQDDIVFVVAHPLDRCGIPHSIEMFKLLHSTGAKIILDLVPHNLYTKITRAELNEILGNGVFAIIGAFSTFMNFMDVTTKFAAPTREHYREIIDGFNTSMIIVRYGMGEISKQTIYASAAKGTYEFITRDENTDYESIPNEEKRGFGDRLTAKLVKQLMQQKLL